MWSLLEVETFTKNVYNNNKLTKKGHSTVALQKTIEYYKKTNREDVDNEEIKKKKKKTMKRQIN